MIPRDRSVLGVPYSVLQFISLLLPIWATACAPANHYLVHPRAPAPGILTSSHEVYRDELRIHIEVARPAGAGPFATVLVHPEGGTTADKMRGIIWDLAGRGYLAMAADYNRRVDGAYRPNLFAWRSPRDAAALVDIATAQPDVDPRCIAVIGFSQGGVYSLLIAAYAPDRVASVVSYYPVTDFPHWFAQERPNPLKRWAYSVVRWFFRQESGATTDAEFEEMLRHASPYYVAEQIQAPVLLVHGDQDTTAPVEESERMAARLQALGKPVELLVVPDGVHIFNFRQRAHAAMAWDATLAWLDRTIGRECRSGSH